MINGFDYSMDNPIVFIEQKLNYQIKSKKKKRSPFITRSASLANWMNYRNSNRKKEANFCHKKMNSIQINGTTSLMSNFSNRTFDSLLI